MTSDLTLDESISELIAALAGEYIKQAQQIFRFLTFVPTPTMEEAAAAWFLGKYAMEKVEDSKDTAGYQGYYQELAKEFFAATFGAIFGYLENRRIGPVPSLEELKKTISTTETLPEERSVSLVNAAGAIAVTAGKLSLATLSLAHLNLSNSQKAGAQKLALSLVEARAMLNDFEIEKATDWIHSATLVKL